MKVAAVIAVIYLPLTLFVWSLCVAASKDGQA